MVAHRTLVIGMFVQDSDADIALNNLAEADFASKDISIAAAVPARAAALSNSPGLWATLTPDQISARLQTLGLARPDAAAYAAAVSSGGMFIAISASGTSAAAAQEMLSDQHATLVRTVALAVSAR